MPVYRFGFRSQQQAGFILAELELVKPGHGFRQVQYNGGIKLLISYITDVQLPVAIRFHIMHPIFQVLKISAGLRIELEKRKTIFERDIFLCVQRKRQEQ